MLTSLSVLSVLAILAVSFEQTFAAAIVGLAALSIAAHAFG